MGTTSSGSLQISAGCRYNAGASLYSAHTGAIEGPLLYAVPRDWCRRRGATSPAGVPRRPRPRLRLPESHPAAQWFRDLLLSS